MSGSSGAPAPRWLSDTRDLADQDYVSGHLTEFWRSRVEALLDVLEGYERGSPTPTMIAAAQGAPTPAMIAALRQIAEYDAATEAGYLDEWVEANAFHRCQAIAAEAVRAALTAQEGGVQRGEPG